MKYLVDTHIALWFLYKKEKLSQKVISIIEDDKNEIYISLASIWEVAIKHKKNPSAMPVDEESFKNDLNASEILLLNIDYSHIKNIKNLIYHDNKTRHNDPFDRMLLVQAITEQMYFITNDSLIPNYNENCIIMNKEPL